MVANDALKIARLEGQIEAYKEIIDGLKKDLADARQPIYNITCEPDKTTPWNSRDYPWDVTYSSGGCDSNANTE